MTSEFSIADRDLVVSSDQDEGIAKFSHYLFACVRLFKSLYVGEGVEIQNNENLEELFEEYEHIREI